MITLFSKCFFPNQVTRWFSTPLPITHIRGGSFDDGCTYTMGCHTFTGVYIYRSLVCVHVSKDRTESFGTSAHVPNIWRQQQGRGVWDQCIGELKFLFKSCSSMSGYVTSWCDITVFLPPSTNCGWVLNAAVKVCCSILLWVHDIQKMRPWHSGLTGSPLNGACCQWERKLALDFLFLFFTCTWQLLFSKCSYLELNLEECKNSFTYIVFFLK